MRRRSCALHSDSEEEFLLLAEYANEKTGYFYDELLHKEISDKMNNKFKTKANQKPSSFYGNFEGFDYGTEDVEKMEQMQELQAQNKARQINFVIICRNHLQVIQKVQELWPDKGQNDTQFQGQRLIDLYIIKILHSNHLHCIKFWLIEPNNSENPICRSYFKRANKIINFEQGQDNGQKWPIQKAKGVIFSMVNALIC